jgi:hypothetical protein
MPERLTWEQIVTKYPHQHIAVTDVKWKRNMSTIESAVVVAVETEMSSQEITGMAVSSHGRIYSEYTGEDPILDGLGRSVCTTINEI